jgi:hypothetical protein
MRMSQLELEALLRKGTVKINEGSSQAATVTIVGGRGAGKTAAAEQWLAQQGDKMKQSRPKMTEEKMALHWALKALCQKYGRPLFEEQRFHETRMWRFDYLIPGCKGFRGSPTAVAIEYEGLLGGKQKTGHTESKRYTGNCDKYNAAALAGIVVLRYTHINWGQAVADLEMFFL